MNCRVLDFKQCLTNSQTFSKKGNAAKTLGCELMSTALLKAPCREARLDSWLSTVPPGRNKGALCLQGPSLLSVNLFSHQCPPRGLKTYSPPSGSLPQNNNRLPSPATTQCSSSYCGNVDCAFTEKIRAEPLQPPQHAARGLPCTDPPPSSFFPSLLSCLPHRASEVWHKS